MPRKRSYDAEFKRRCIGLLETSRKSVNEVSRELEIPARTVKQWWLDHRRSLKEIAGSDAVGGNPPASTEEQLKVARRELAHLTEDVAILKKALAICSVNGWDRSKGSR